MRSTGLEPTAVRRIVLEQSKRAGVGHIGSNLSIAEIVSAIFAVARGAASDDPDRDRVILSKGHAALALYAALHLAGRISQEDLDTFCGDDTLLGTHPESQAPGVDFATGSLGHGLSIGAGAALAARLQGSPRRTFVVVSDAECNEGSTWEAVMFAAHHGLGNLVAVVDENGQQALGYTHEVLDLSPLADRWAAFGWDVNKVNGHDLEALTSVLDGLPNERIPHVVIADTTFGKGVSFMESLIKWHYWPMSDDEYAEALAELEVSPHG